jgi:hypothetical protein
MRICRIMQILALAIVAHGTPSRSAEGELETPKANRTAKARLEMMRKVIDDFDVRSLQVEPPAALKFHQEPLLRYNDPSRPGDKGAQSLLDATVWRLGETGRPTAIVTLEVYPRNEATAVLSYEFVSLSPLPFEIKNSHGVTWTPSSTQLTITPLLEAPEPADTKRSRLVQMRQLARRFTAQAEWQGDKTECRLLAQPIDRYDDEAAGIVDGAVFVFANGANPEMGLLLECSEKHWSYGVFRLTAATLSAQLDGKPFDPPSKSAGNPVLAPTTGMQHEIELPK